MCLIRQRLFLHSYKHDWSRKFGTIFPDIVTGSMYCFVFIYNASNKTDIMFAFIQAWLVELLNLQCWTYQLTDFLRLQARGSVKQTVILKQASTSQHTPAHANTYISRCFLNFFASEYKSKYFLPSVLKSVQKVLPLMRYWGFSSAGARSSLWPPLPPLR